MHPGELRGCAVQKKSLAIIYRLEDGAYEAAQWDPERNDYSPDVPGLVCKGGTLPEGLRFRDVETALEGRVTEGRALTRFLPQGFATATWIHLEDDEGAAYTVVVHPLLGRAEVQEGRIDAP
ncbi:MAG: hypothetical protein Kow0092_32960 [Deferrisomatales bacterium]